MSICQVAVDGGVRWDVVGPQKMLDMVAETIKKGALVFDAPTEHPAMKSNSAIVKSTNELDSPLQLSLNSEERNHINKGLTDPQETPLHDIAQGSRANPPDDFNIIEPQESMQEEAAGDSKTTQFSEAVKGLKINSEIMKRLSNLPEAEIQKLMDVDFIYLLDSGGQPPFREMFPHFVQQASAIVLMQKLNEKLDFKPTIRYREKEGKVDEGYISQLSNEQILYQHIQAVQSHQSKVFVVGSHADREGECEESIDMKNKRLLETFLPAVGSHMVMYQMGDPDELIFPVNSTSRELADVKITLQFKERVMKSCTGVKKKVPLPWFILEQVLQLLALEMKVTVLSINECVEASEKVLYMSHSDCRAAIEYLGQLNIMFYRPNILPGVVFVDAQVILDKITELVRCNHALRIHKGKGSVDEQKVPLCMQGGEGFAFRQLGLIDAELLGKAFSSHFRDDLFTAADLLKLLEGLLIAARHANGKHFIPSLLPDLSVEDIAGCRIAPSKHLAPEVLDSSLQTLPPEYRESTRPSPLVFHYHKKWVPVGVMPSLVVYLQNQCKWELSEKHGKPTCMYHNCIQFKLPGGEPGSIFIIDSTKFLEIHVKPILEIAPELLIRIRQHILTGLEEVHKSLNYDLAEAKIGFMCSGVCGNSDPHLARLNDKKVEWTCSEDGDIGGTLDKGQKLWHLTNYCKGQICTHL